MEEPGAAATESSNEPMSESMVIYVQQGEGGELSVPVLATRTSLDPQVITLGYTAGTEDDLPSLASSEQPLTLVEGGEESEMVSDLLGSVVDGEDFTSAEQRTGAFQTEDGQILYVTYTVNPIQEENNSEDGLIADDVQQRMILHVSEDGSTMMLPAEEELDLANGEHYPQFTVDSVYSLTPSGRFVEETLTAPVVAEAKAGKDTSKLKQRPFVEINNRRRTEQVIGSELRIEEKLEVLNAMLTPVPEKVRKTKRGGKEGATDGGVYVCDMCGATFARAAQYYGHLHSHSGERKWSCSACPVEVEFQSQSQLRRHEKQCHLNLRPHTCMLCSARFDRASQLSYHERRIHAGERPHTCQICRKSFFKRSDLRTHLNIHLGINKSICETCGKKFNHISNLIRHTRMHSGIKPYPCTVCGRRFSQLNAMHQHKISHQSGKDVSCTVCSKMFKSHAIMRKHVRHMHADKDTGSLLKSKVGGQTRRFYCKVCGESFEFAALLKEHENQHEKENNFHCSCCGQDYSSVKMLKSHSCQTPQERLQRAVEAEEEAERMSLNSQLESLLQEHSGLMNGELIIYVTHEGQSEPTEVHIKPLSTATGDLKPVVLFDGKVVPNAELEGSVREEGDGSAASRDSPCEMLLFEGNSSGAGTDEPEPVSTGTSSALQLELEPICINVNTPPSSPLLQQNTGLSDHFITACSEDLMDLGRMTANAGRTVDPLALPLLCNDSDSVDLKADIVSDTESKKKKTRIYQCPECPKTFLKNSNFKQHLGIHYIDQMNSCCPTCGQYFAWKSTLNKHILRSHPSGPPPRCRCDICHREYASAGQVQEHIKRDHYKQRPHSCPACKKTFYKKYDLKIHLRTHTKERPYICGTCGKSFYHVSHIIRHERIHSGHCPYKCSDCGRQFNQSSSLKSHRQRHVQNLEKHGLGLVRLAQNPDPGAVEQANILFLSGAM